MNTGRCSTVKPYTYDCITGRTRTLSKHPRLAGTRSLLAAIGKLVVVVSASRHHRIDITGSP